MAVCKGSANEFDNVMRGRERMHRYTHLCYYIVRFAIDKSSIGLIQE